MQPQRAGAFRVGVGVVVGGMQPPQDVDLLVDLALAQHLLQRLDRARLDGGEAVQLEDLAQGVEHVLLDGPAVGQPLGESGQ